MYFPVGRLKHPTRVPDLVISTIEQQHRLSGAYFLNAQKSRNETGTRNTNMKKSTAIILGLSAAVLLVAIMWFSGASAGEIGAGVQLPAGKGLNAPEATVISGQSSGVNRQNEDDPTSTNRPMRKPHRLVLTVGQSEGDLRGTDDKIIQAGIDYLYRLGGGVLHILPGEYIMNNSVFLRPGITLRGSGENTVLKKGPGAVTPLVRDSDWYEYGVEVESTDGFKPGSGIMLRSERKDWGYEVLRATVTEISGNVIYFDQRTEENFWLSGNSTAATIFPILTAMNVDNVCIEDIVLDGNKERNENINGNYSGGVFIQYCNNWIFKNVVSRNYNGDGYSWQVCDDVHFINCKSLDNANLGFHPGSGSQRPIIRNCESRGNSQGIFFCWGVSDGIAENCILSDNRQYGVSIGHRDTDNIIRNCVIERNGEVGILFRDEGDNEFNAGHRNTIDACTIRDNAGPGIDIRWVTRDIIIQGNIFANTGEVVQKPAIRIGEKAGAVRMENNEFRNSPDAIKDLRP